MPNISVPARTPFRLDRAALGAGLGLAGHLLAFAVGYLAARLARPSQGGGFADLAAAVFGFFGVELLVALTCVVTGVLLLVRGRRDLGSGLLLGWFVGAVASWAFVQVESVS
jgi:hypothetical protein